MMLEEKVGQFLHHWLSDALKEYVTGVWSQVPPSATFPYLHIRLGDVFKMPFENRIRVRFTLSIASQYKGQKETLSILHHLKNLLEDPLHPQGVFKIDTQDVTATKSDKATRQTHVHITGLLPLDMGMSMDCRS